MKRSLLIFLVLVVFAATGAFAQTWEVVKESTPDDPNAGFFLNATTGWLVDDEGLVKQTTNGGADWTVLRAADGSGLDWTGVEFVDVNTGYACADDGYVWKTVDGGTTWTMVGDTANCKNDLNALDVISADVVVCVGSNSTFIKTVNGGTNWTVLIDAEVFDSNPLNDVAFMDENVGVVLDNGVGGTTWYTHDGGTNWTFSTVAGLFPLGTTSTRCYTVSAGPDSVFVLGGYHYCIFKSTDGGKTYERMGDFTYDLERYVDSQIIDGNNFYLVGTSSHIVKTTDAGANWEPADVPSGQTPNFTCFLNATDGFVFSSYGQWFYTNDGGSNWNHLLDWPGVSFWGMALPTDDKIVLTAWGGGELSISEDDGKTWTYPSNAATGTGTNLYECEFVSEDVGFIGGGSGMLAKTEDGGLSWTRIDNPMAQESNKHVNAMNYLDSDTLFVGGSSGYMMRSTDGGTTWSSTKIGTQTNYDVWPFSGSYVFVAAGSGQLKTGLYTAPDAVTTTELNDFGTMVMRAVEFRNGVGIIPAASGHVYRVLESDLNTITEVFTDGDGDDLYDVEFVNDSLVYMVGELGKIYKSVDAGLTWVQESNPSTTDLTKIKYRDGRLYAIGEKGTILMLNLSDHEVLSLDQWWEKDAGGNLTLFQNDHLTRSMTINPIDGHMYVATRTGTHQIYGVNANTGNAVGKLDMTGVSGGGYHLNLVDVADDGVIYACNLAYTAGSQVFKIYRWADFLSAPTVAFEGTAGYRVGDSFTAVGSGTNTVLYASGSGSESVYVYTTTDGLNFTMTHEIPVTATLAGGGIAPVSSAYGASIWTNRAGQNVSLVDFNGNVLATIGGDVMSIAYHHIDYLETTAGQKLIAVAGGNVEEVSRKVEVWNVDDPSAPFLYAQGEATGPWLENLNGTGTALLREVDGELYVYQLVTNNIMACYSTAAAEPVVVSVKEAGYDANGDFIPDLLGETLTVSAVITTPNYGSHTQYYMQGIRAGIQLYSGSYDFNLNYGDEIQLTGEVAQYRGSTEIMPVSAEALTLLSSGNTVEPVVTTVAGIGEDLESQLVRVNDVWLVEPSQWPASGSNGNVYFTDGVDTNYVFIDKETDLDGWTPPQGKMDMIAIVDQYTSSSSVYNDGWSLRGTFQENFIDKEVHLPLVEEVADGTLDLNWVQNVPNGDGIIFAADSTGNTWGSYVAVFVDTTYTGLMHVENALLSDFTISADFYLVGDPNVNEALYKGLGFRMSHDETAYFRFVYRNSSASAHGQLRLQGYDGAAWHISKYWEPGTDFTAITTGWHNLKVTVIGNDFYAYLDGEMLPGCPYQDEAPFRTEGYPGVFKYNDPIGAVIFDNFRVTEPEEVAIDDNPFASTLPTEYALYQNYPNPFNPMTTLSFALPKAGQVELTVYNMMGQKVAEVHQGYLDVGYHRFEFAANSLSSGIYFYRLQADGFADIKKMTILK